MRAALLGPLVVVAHGEGAARDPDHAGGRAGVFRQAGIVVAPALLGLGGGCDEQRRAVSEHCLHGAVPGKIVFQSSFMLTRRSSASASAASRAWVKVRPCCPAGRSRVVGVLALGVVVQHQHRQPRAGAGRRSTPASRDRRRNCRTRRSGGLPMSRLMPIGLPGPSSTKIDLGLAHQHRLAVLRSRTWWRCSSPPPARRDAVDPLAVHGRTNSWPPPVTM